MSMKAVWTGNWTVKVNGVPMRVTKCLRKAVYLVEDAKGNTAFTDGFVKHGLKIGTFSPKAVESLHALALIEALASGEIPFHTEETCAKHA